MIGEELQRLLEPLVGRLGYELLDLESHFSGRNKFLRLTIDNPNGIGLNDCEKVSRAASAFLDIEDPIPGDYNLEVSSPGLDRKLKKVEHFHKFEGDTIKISMRLPFNGRKRFQGVLISSDCENIVIEVDGEMHNLPFSNIDTARLDPKNCKSQGKFGVLRK
tara:strand:- start:1260 stop:1745 length:486 start_codon:yes stop_codon:yes gene_type:complete